jgi:hypothetical protein
MSNNTTIDFPSILPNLRKARLSFRILPNSGGHGTAFLVSVETSELTASVESSTSVKGPPSILFKDIASNWRGWAGEKHWEDLDETVQLIATCDRTGHVQLTVIFALYPYPKDHVRVSLSYEAGSLEQMSMLLSDLFDRHAT